MKTLKQTVYSDVQYSIDHSVRAFITGYLFRWEEFALGSRTARFLVREFIRDYVAFATGVSGVRNSNDIVNEKTKGNYTGNRL